MIGAILGDIIGSPYEFDRGNKSKDFPLFSDNSVYTDDTVMTLADCRAYHSFGNGSAMRVSSVVWLYNDVDAVRHAARLSAEVTHNHPEGIKGAEATASAIFLARTGHSKAEIKEYIEQEFDYKLNRTCDEIRPNCYHTETCMETVPEAITAFLEGDYGIPAKLKEECYNRLPEPLLEVLEEFEEHRAAGERLMGGR